MKETSVSMVIFSCLLAGKALCPALSIALCVDCISARRALILVAFVFAVKDNDEMVFFFPSCNTDQGV